MVMQLRSCCCGCSLRTGTIIIAVLGFLGGVSFIVEGFFPTADGGAPKNSTVGPITVQPALLPAFNVSRNGTDDDIIPGGQGVRVSKTIYGFLEAIICALLFTGAINNSPKLIFPWIVMSVILAILGAIIFVGIGIFFCWAGLMAFGLTYIVLGFLATLLHVYFILVVNSFHSTLKSGQVSRA